MTFRDLHVNKATNVLGGKEKDRRPTIAIARKKTFFGNIQSMMNPNKIEGKPNKIENEQTLDNRIKNFNGLTIGYQNLKNIINLKKDLIIKKQNQ